MRMERYRTNLPKGFPGFVGIPDEVFPTYLSKILQIFGVFTTYI